MKYLLPLLISLIYCQGVNAESILQSVEDSQTSEYHTLIRDRLGRIVDKINRVTTYIYLDNNGDKVKKDFKVTGLPDNRNFSLKHPVLKFLLLELNNVQIVVPINL